MTYKVIQSKLDDDDETAILHFSILMSRYTKPNDRKKALVGKSSNISNLSFDSYSSLDPKDFFRIRRADWKDGKLRPFERDDLFHIKYHDRRKCKNYRFSISGIPALYLGESIQLCEHEVFNGDVPSEYYISQFRNLDLLNVITIDFPELVIWAIKNVVHDVADWKIKESHFYRFFMYLPFTISCLFKTAPPHNHFY